MRRCRSCSPSSRSASTPLADALVTARSTGRADELFVPLDVVFCAACSLVQIAADGRSGNSVLPLLSVFLVGLAGADEALREQRGSAHRAAGPRTRAASSSRRPATTATCCASFTNAVFRCSASIPPTVPRPAAQAQRHPDAQHVLHGGARPRSCGPRAGCADLFLANNVLAHVADLNGFVDGIATLLAPTGTAVIECPYVVDLIEHCEFDTIYHQHLCYFSVTALDALFRRHGLFLNRVERTAIHGGSLRLFVAPFEAVEDSVRELADVRTFAPASRDFAYYRDFAERVDALKRSVDRGSLRTLQAPTASASRRTAPPPRRTRCWRTSASTRRWSTTSPISTPFKIGRYMGGNHLPIVDPAALVGRPARLSADPRLELRRRDHEAASRVP